MSWGSASSLVSLVIAQREWFQATAGEIQAGQWEVLLLRKGGQALEWTARGGGGVTDNGSVQGTIRCCVEGHGLVGAISDR